MRALAAAVVSLCGSAATARAQVVGGFELDLGLTRGPFRYEAVTGLGNRVRVETELHGFTLDLGARGGLHLGKGFVVGPRLLGGVSPNLEGSVQASHFAGGLHGRAQLAAWRAPADEVEIGLAGGVGVLALAYSTDEAVAEDAVGYDGATLRGPVLDAWVAHPFADRWSVGAVAGVAWLSSERTLFTPFSAALRLSFEPWRPEPDGR